MRIYIAGKITGERFYKLKFFLAEWKLKRMGHSVMNPAWLNGYPEFHYNSYMDVTRAMQEQCEAVLFLKNWRWSPGAIKEHTYALQNNQRVFYSIDQIPDKN